MTVQFRNVRYTTLDRLDTFVFDFVQVSNVEWRAYIISQPSYNGLPAAAHEAHRLHDARGCYVCWAPAPRTLNEAKGAARAWADATQGYIRTGRFPAPEGPRYVPDLSTSSGWVHSDRRGAIPGAAAPVPPQSLAPRPRAQAQAPESAQTPAGSPSMRVTTSRPTGLRGLFARRTR